MQIPNGSSAYIPVEKLRDYILSQAHPIGRFKFAFFRSLGYEPDDFERLATDIRAMLGADAELSKRRNSEPNIALAAPSLGQTAGRLLLLRSGFSSVPTLID